MAAAVSLPIADRTPWADLEVKLGGRLECGKGAADSVPE
jgi:hypothetical protein